MEEKIKWTYSAIIQGGMRVNGSLSASNPEEAVKLVKQFGFLDWKLTDPNGVVIEDRAEEIRPQSPPAPPHVLPPMPIPIIPRLVPPSTQQPTMNPSPSPSRKEVRRQQTVICGPQKEVLPSLKEDMSRSNAKVAHVVMHPDAHGVMWFVFVVEFDQEDGK